VSGLNCVLTLQNTGTANAAVNACYVQNAGAPEGGTMSAGTPSATYTVGAGTTETLTCTVAHVGSTAGSQVTGSLSMSNGASVPFTGVWLS
jgi:hypothetical protein